MREIFDNYFAFATTVFMGLFAIVNPISSIPVFLELTSNMDKPQRRNIATKSVLIAFCIIAVFSVAGKLIFHVFGITLAALRVTGGILVFVIGYEMVRGKDEEKSNPKLGDQPVKADHGISAAITPLAMPLLAGPGTITTAMSYSAAKDVYHLAIVMGVYGLICYITFLLFLAGDKIVNVIGTNVMMVITKMMGLILAVIGVQMLALGVMELFKL
ncbi:MarC family protein [Chitinophaga sp. sic0106]|uniref:MarC family protein n=1 Tax=Chitinophaga sp. sic0106 TaxID=2854785 RepID=UPI001C48968A|nr:MarC family protein [Chitinophaga sp. sic0106]MBV7529921.1 MarC family protein [Chitinophaga sp. sic0106]